MPALAHQLGPMTLLELFARGRPDDAHATFALMPDGRAVSYADADRLSGKVAQLLHAEGVRRGDRVAVQLEKSLSSIWIYLACLRAGAVMLPMNPAYTEEEVRYLLDDASPSLVFADPGTPAARLGSKVFTCAADETGSLADAVADFSGNFADPPAAPEDIALLCYTSGTTGRPKGAVLSHRNLASNAHSLIELWGFNEADVLIHVLPLFHVHGILNGLHCVLGSGSTLRFFPRFEPSQVLEVLPQSSVFMGVPTHYHRLLGEPGLDRKACVRFRLFICGSAPLQASLLETFEARTGHRILERYGMTETAMIASNPLIGERRAGTVGFPLPDVDVRIVEPDSLRRLPRGAVGAIEVRGPNVFAGYFGRPELTATEFSEDGFFRTGDLGLIDEEGYLSIVGRAKDVVISGGLNVYPKEIEQVLDAFPGIAESAVVGTPDADLGEVVVAFVVAQPGAPLDEPEIRRSLRSSLAGFKVPKRVVVLEELPRNAMGKVEKAVLRDYFSASDDAADKVAPVGRD